MLCFVSAYGEMMYVRFYKDGNIYDYGPLTFGPCAAANADPISAEAVSSTGETLPDMGSLCLKTSLFCDQLYMNIDYIWPYGVIFGYSDDCGAAPYTAAGFVTGDNFMIYLDFAESTSSWGAALFGTVSGMGGTVNFLELIGTAASLDYYADFSFVPCTTTVDAMPPLSMGPLAK
jgi:hypothetical protein